MFELAIFSCSAYAVISLCFLTYRFVKIVDLYREYQMVRAREQRLHIRSHAQLLFSEIKSDLAWPVSMFIGFKGALAWMREK